MNLTQDIIMAATSGVADEVDFGVIDDGMGEITLLCEDDKAMNRIERHVNRALMAQWDEKWEQFFEDCDLIYGSVFPIGRSLRSLEYDDNWRTSTSNSAKLAAWLSGKP